MTLQVSQMIAVRLSMNDVCNYAEALIGECKDGQRCHGEFSVSQAERFERVARYIRRDAKRAEAATQATREVPK